MTAERDTMSKGCCWLVVVLLAALVVPADVQACSCVSSPTPWEARARADLVFTGTVLDVQRDETTRETTLRVQKAWEGDPGRQIAIRTHASTAACGYPFKMGERYLVYAYADEGGYYTHSCTRTAILENAETDIDAFEALFLGANEPDPFRGTTTINLGLPRRMAVSLDVFDSSGRLVKTLIRRPLSAGTHRVDFDGSALPAGVYYYRLQAEEHLLTRSMVVVH